jgi:hypothetical protein
MGGPHGASWNEPRRSVEARFTPPLFRRHLLTTIFPAPTWRITRGPQEGNIEANDIAEGLNDDTGRPTSTKGDERRGKVAHIVVGSPTPRYETPRRRREASIGATSMTANETRRGHAMTIPRWNPPNTEVLNPRRRGETNAKQGRTQPTAGYGQQRQRKNTAREITRRQNPTAGYRLQREASRG